MYTGLDEYITNVLDADVKEYAHWLFEVDSGATGEIDHRWTAGDDVTYGGENYTFKVIKFDDIDMARGQAEVGIQAPSKFRFTITNKDNTLRRDSFTFPTEVTVRAVVKADLRMQPDPGAGGAEYQDRELEATRPVEAEIRVLRFAVNQITSVGQTMTFHCKDWLTDILEGYYPNEPLVHTLWPAKNCKLISGPGFHNQGKGGLYSFGDWALPEADTCVPVIFGNPTIPVTAVYLNETDLVKYLLGPSSGVTYSVDFIKSPRDWTGGHEGIFYDSEYTTNQYARQGSDGQYYKFYELLALDCLPADEPDGTPDTNLFWGVDYGDDVEFYNVPMKYSRSDTVELTNPAEVIEYILEDMGVPSDRIDDDSKAAAAAIFDGWGLEWHGGFWRREKRRDIIARLLVMCHMELIVRDKIYFKVHSAEVQHVVEKEWVEKGTFKMEPVEVQEDNDCVNVAYQEANECLDQLLVAEVAVKDTSDNPTDEVVRADFVQNSVHAQKLGILAGQRKLRPDFLVSGYFKGKCLQLECDDVISVHPADYGNWLHDNPSEAEGRAYHVLIDKMRISRDLKVHIEAVHFRPPLDDWGDLDPDPITQEEIPTLKTFKKVTSGPDAYDKDGKPIGNVLYGRLRIIDSNYDGSEIILDGDNALIRVLDSDGDYIDIDAANLRLISSDYTAGQGGAGFIVSPGLIEAGYLASRGIMRNVTFQNDAIGGMGGSLLIPKGADVLAANMTALDACSVQIEGNTTLAVGDVLRMYEGSDDEWMQVTSAAAAPIYAVDRDKAGDYAADSNPAWKKGASVINYGQSGDGAIFLNAGIGDTAPAIWVLTHAGSPWDTITVPCVMGNLNGYAGYVTDTYGFAAYKDANNYAKMTASGIEIAGTITITGGDTTLDDIADGDDYGRVALTAIAAGKILLTAGAGVSGSLPVANSDAKCTDPNADQTSANTAADTSAVNGVPSSIVSAWRQGATTYINGGYIYTNTVVASHINGGAFGTLNITSGAINVATSGGFTVKSGGNMQLWSGTDIAFYSDTGSTLRGYINSHSTYFRIVGNSVPLMLIGSSISLQTAGNTTIQNAQFSTDVTIMGNKTFDVFGASNAADDIYADDFQNVADFYHLDEFDDLAVLHAIKGSGVIDERTGLELIDDDTLAEWMLSRYKADGMPIYKPDKRYKEGRRQIGESKKGDIMYDPEDKPWVSNAIWFSLLKGGLCQTDMEWRAEVGALRQEMEQLKQAVGHC